MANRSNLVEKYFRVDNLPHIWCPGCSHGAITRSIVTAIDELKLDKDNTVIVSGIGCSSRAPGYLDFHTVHTTHGRALAFATGIKMSKPDMNVIVITGDGDASAIGGNHLIHAARRNIDITTIVFNNNIYGMTGGQYSPTTPHNDFATTAPFGNIDTPFDIADLAAAAGATYVAKGDAYHVMPLIKNVKTAIKHKGFSLVEVIASCPTYYGRKNRKGTVVDMLNWMKDTFIPKSRYDKLSDEEKIGKHYYGEIKNVQAPEYSSRYMQLIESLKGDRNAD